MRELYASQPGLPAKNAVDAGGWEKSALSEIGQAAGFQDAYASAFFQAAVALELMTMAVSENPPRTVEESAQCANEAVAAQLKAIAARFATTENERS